jgi:tetratricopeptide (TPR) repeat protein
LAYLALGDPKRAIPMLDATAHDFPSDYNPEIRLARVYKELGDFVAARRHAERAMTLVYGPRLLRVHAMAADIAEAKKDRTAAIADLETALKKTEDLPLGPGYRKFRGELADRLAKLKK